MFVDDNGREFDCKRILNDRSSWQRHIKAHSMHMPFWCYFCGSRMKEK